MLQDIAAWLAVAVSVLTLAYTIYSARSKAAAAKVHDLERRVDKVEDRATKIESGLAHLPDKEITHRLELSIMELKAEIGVLSERIKPVAAVSQRMQEFMMERESV